MRLSIITDEVSQDLSEALSYAQSRGLDAVELRSAWGVNLCEASDEQVASARALVKESGLPVCCLASPVYKADLEAVAEPVGATHGASNVALEQQLALAERACQIANSFECPIVRIFSFWKRGDLSHEIFRSIVEKLAELEGIAERYGIVFALENEHSCWLGTGEETAKAVRSVGDWLKIVWDPGNAFCAGGDPNEGLLAALPFIAHVHVKDARKTDEGYEWAGIDEGEIDFDFQFARLKEAGYKGAVSIETHAKKDGMSQADVTDLCLNAVRKRLT